MKKKKEKERKRKKRKIERKGKKRTKRGRKREERRRKGGKETSEFKRSQLTNQTNSNKRFLFCHDKVLLPTKNPKTQKKKCPQKRFSHFFLGLMKKKKGKKEKRKKEEKPKRNTKKPKREKEKKEEEKTHNQQNEKPKKKKKPPKIGPIISTLLYLSITFLIPMFVLYCCSICYPYLCIVLLLNFVPLFVFLILFNLPVFASFIFVKNVFLSLGEKNIIENQDMSVLKLFVLFCPSSFQFPLLPLKNTTTLETIFPGRLSQERKEREKKKPEEEVIEKSQFDNQTQD